MRDMMDRMMGRGVTLVIPTAGTEMQRKPNMQATVM